LCWAGANLKIIFKKKNFFVWFFCIYICSHQNIMENIATSLKVRCVRAGITLKEVCRRAGVTPVTMRNWQKEEPKSIRIYREMLRVIEEVEKEKADTNAEPAAISK
jgi:hypothetical protein